MEEAYSTMQADEGILFPIILKNKGDHAMKINCLSCGHKVDVDDAYSDYEGQIKCFVCSAILEICAIDGNLRYVKLANVHDFQLRSQDNEQAI